MIALSSSSDSLIETTTGMFSNNSNISNTKQAMTTAATQPRRRKCVQWAEQERTDIPIASPIDVLMHSSSSLYSSSLALENNASLSRYDVSSNPLHEQDVSPYFEPSIWYAAHELEDFRNEVRQICRNIKYQSRETLVGLHNMHYFRGLEQRTSLERQRRKILAIKCIVRAQQKFDDVGLASVAARCNAWASALATREAARDYYRAYAKEEEAVTVQEEPRKRMAASSAANEERSVRPRLAVDTF